MRSFRQHGLGMTLTSLPNSTELLPEREHELDPQPRRVAGFLYLRLVVTGPVRIIYIPSKLFVVGNSTAGPTTSPRTTRCSVSASSVTCLLGPS